MGSPTNVPTTGNPTSSPSMEPTEEPEPTLPDAEQVLAELDNISFIYIVCGALVLFYVFICGYIWCNERRKRQKLEMNFKNGSDREQRIEYLRAKNQERKRRLQAQRGLQVQVDQKSPHENPL